MTDPRRSRQRLKRLLVGEKPRRTLFRALVLGLFTFLVMRYVLLPTRIRGISMEPTYTDGGIEFVNLLVYRFNEPARGDIVIIRMAGRRAFYLKRIIGLPGERIEFVDGQRMVNGQPMPEPYVHGRSDWTIPEVVLAEGEYYVVGDNRGIRWEQHALGIVDREHILGRVAGGT